MGKIIIYAFTDNTSTMLSRHIMSLDLLSTISRPFQWSLFINSCGTLHNPFKEVNTISSSTAAAKTILLKPKRIYSVRTSL